MDSSAGAIVVSISDLKAESFVLLRYLWNNLLSLHLPGRRLEVGIQAQSTFIHFGLVRL